MFCFFAFSVTCCILKVFTLRIGWFKTKKAESLIPECYKKSSQIVIETIKSWSVVDKMKWLGYFSRNKSHLRSSSNSLTVISEKYLVLNILVGNVKFIQRFISILAGSTNHTARKLPTHETTVCPICGIIYVEIYVTTSHRLEVLATRVIPLKL